MALTAAQQAAVASAWQQGQTPLQIATTLSNQGGPGTSVSWTDVSNHIQTTFNYTAPIGTNATVSTNPLPSTTSSGGTATQPAPTTTTAPAPAPAPTTTSGSSPTSGTGTNSGTITSTSPTGISTTSTGMILPGGLTSTTAPVPNATPPQPTSPPAQGMMWVYDNTAQQWVQNPDPSFNPAPAPSPTPVPAPAPVPGSVNPFAPGNEPTTNTTINTTGFGSQPGVVSGTTTPRQLSTDQQLAVQQAELNRQQLEGALNQRGISQSGRGDLLRDIQGLQSELQVGQTARLDHEGPSRLAPGDGSEHFGGPSLSPQPEAAPAPPMGSPAFNALKAPEISSLNEPDAFGDLRAALGAQQQAESAQRGQTQGGLGQPGAAEAAAMRQIGTVMPGFGSFLDPMASMQAHRNGLGKDGKNLASPSELFQLELAAQRRQESTPQELAASVLQSWQRAQAIQVQQEDLLEQFNTLNRATGVFAPTGEQTQDPNQGRQAAALRDQIIELERTKVAAAKRTQDQFKQFERSQNVIEAGANASAGMKRATQQHRDRLARMVVQHLGSNPDEVTGRSGLSALQVVKTQYSLAELEQLATKIGRNETILGA